MWSHEIPRAGSWQDGLGGAQPAIGLDNRILGDAKLRRRLPDEVSPGLWDLPGAFPGTGPDVSAGADEAAALLPFAVTVGDAVGTLRHGVTYRKIALEIREASLKRGGGVRSAGGSVPLTGPDGAELCWERPADADSRALSSPARRILQRWGAS